MGWRGKVGRLVLRRLAAWCYRRRRRVLAIWVVALIGFSVLGQTAGGALQKTFSLPGTESDRAFSVLEHEFARKGDTGDLVFEVRGSGDVNSPAVRNEIEPVFAELRRQPHVVSVTSPYDPAGSRFVARGGKIAYAEILFDVQANDVPVDLASRHARRSPRRRTRLVCGSSSVARCSPTRSQPASEVIGILAAVVILLIAFGSLLAMGLPIMTALFGIGIGLAFVTLLARVHRRSVVRAAGHGDDRYRRRYRLRAVHQHPLPRSAARGSRPRAGGRPRDRHERPCRAVRRRHGRHLAARALPHRRVVHPRSRGRRRAGGAVRDGRRGHACSPRCSASSATRSTSWRCPSAKQTDATSEHSFWARWSRTFQARPWPAAIVGLVILVVLAMPFFSAAARRRRRGQRPDEVHDPTRLRPAQPGLRSRLQRAAARRERTAISPATVAAMAATRGATIARDARRRPGQPASIPSPNGKA